MGFFGGMKERLGFGEQPEWQDDGYLQGEDSFDEPYDDGYVDDGYADDGYVDDGYADDGYADDGYSDSGYSSSVSFDTYDPNKFSNVSLGSSSRELKVAPMGDSRDSYFGRRSSGMAPYASNIGTSSSRRSSYDNVRSINDRPSAASASGAPTWSTPADPSFLDTPAAKRSHDLYENVGVSSDPYSQFDSEIKQMRRDPSASIEIVKPMSYSDVEKIASAVKASKTVVLVLRATKNELAKRILDFSFGVACGLDGTVDKLADKVFVISKSSAQLSEQSLAYLRQQGIIG